MINIIHIIKLNIYSTPQILDYTRDTHATDIQGLNLNIYLWIFLTS